MAKPKTIPWVGLVSLEKDRSEMQANELRNKCPPPHKKIRELGEVGKVDAT